MNDAFIRNAQLVDKWKPVWIYSKSETDLLTIPL